MGIEMYLKSYWEHPLLLLNLIDPFGAVFQSDPIDNDEEYDAQSDDESVWITLLYSFFYFSIKVFSPTL